MKNDVAKLIDSLYKTYNTLNPFALAEQMQIDVKFVPFKDRPYGSVRIILEKAIIFININKKSEHFYICAHELYHAVAHRNSYHNYQTNIVAKAKMEIEANLFASQLITNDYFLQYKKQPDDFQTIQKHYGLSDELEEYFI